MYEKKYNSKKSGEVRQELGRSDSRLLNIDYNLEHTVPKGYWKAQQEDIFNIIKSQKTVKKESGRIFKIWPYVAAVAAVMIIGIMVFLPQYNSDTIGDDGFLSGIEIAELEEYIIDEAGLLYDSGELDEIYWTIE